MDGMDLYLTYSFMKRLVAPFEEWEAFKLGVIDKDGNILLKDKERNSQQKKAFTKFDLLVLKLKKLLAKVPGGSSKMASFAAALWLIKENDELIETAETLTEEEMMESFKHFIIVAQKSSNVNERFEFWEETLQASSGLVDQNNDMGADYGKAKRKKMMRRKVDEALSNYSSVMGARPAGQRAGSKPASGLGRGHDTDGYKPKPAVSKNPKPSVKINKVSSSDTANTSQ